MLIFASATAETCILEGFKCIAIEKEPDYIPLIEQRLLRAGIEVAS
ncbi:methyltransferase [Mycobacterium phage Klein]|nr:methyltransferase [Mycobacterium phage Klein]